MNAADRLPAALAAAQRQVVTREQAHEVGLTRSSLDRRVAGGLLVPYGPHTLHFAGSVPSWRGRLLAGLLDLGPAHSSAGVPRPPCTDWTASQRDRSSSSSTVDFASDRRSAVCSRPVRSAPLTVSLVDGLRATPRNWHHLGAAGRVSERDWGTPSTAPAVLGLTAPGFLRRRLEQIGRRGRDGVTAFDRVMESAGVQSWLERELLALLAGTGLPTPPSSAPTARMAATSPASTSTSIRRPSSSRWVAVADT